MAGLRLLALRRVLGTMNILWFVKKAGQPQNNFARKYFYVAEYVFHPMTNIGGQRIMAVLLMDRTRLRA